MPGDLNGFRHCFHQDAGDNEYFVCNRCGKRICGRNGSTSGCKQHLMRCKKDPKYETYHFLMDPKAFNAKNSTNSAASISINESSSKASNNWKQNQLNDYYTSSNQQHLDGQSRKRRMLDNVARWIVEEMIPISTVESPTFRRLGGFYNCGVASQYSSKGSAKDLAKGLVKSPPEPPIVTRKAVDEWIINKVIEVKSGLREMCKLEIISVTVDHWTSRARQNYTGMTAHWIDEQFVFHSVDLGCWLHEGKSDATSILKDFMETFVDELKFDESTTIFAVTSDTTGNMNTFGRNLKNKNVHHLYCTDHNIQLTAKEAFNDKHYKELSDNELNHPSLEEYDLREHDIEMNDDDMTVLEKLRDLVAHFNKSTQAVDDLKKVQKYMDERTRRPKILLQDVATRWWSTYRTIARALEVKESLDFMARRKNMIPPERCLTEEEWKCLKEIGFVLQPFAQAQKMLEGDKYVTSSLVCPVEFFLEKKWVFSMQIWQHKSKFVIIVSYLLYSYNW